MPGLPCEPESAAAGCPKSMVFGPCGGVAADGTCELGDRHCVFVDLIEAVPAEPSRPAPLTAAAAAMRSVMAARPVIVADFPARAMDLESTRECADLLAGAVDAVLAGDAGSARVQFSPDFRASLISERGLPVWAGLNCRDRNRVALEGELASLAALGVAGVHCVTGDHTASGHRPDATPVFDLDSTRLAALAAAAGHLVSVGESPATPPVALRPARLVEKERAGAAVCFVNHCGEAERVSEFIDHARRAGSVADFLACVPLVIDRGSAELLRSFTSLVLPAGFLERILGAADPFSEGVAATTELAARMLQVDGVRGVNLSGGPTPGREVDFARAEQQIARRLATG